MHIYEMDPLLQKINLPMHYGSIERVVMSITKGLRGEDISTDLVVLSGSDDEIMGKAPLFVDTVEQQMLEVANNSESGATPIIHVHRRALLETGVYDQSKEDVKTVVTLHGPAEKVAASYRNFIDSDISFVTVSLHQATQLYERGFRIAGTINNGVDTDYYIPDPIIEPEYMTIIARICPEKNQADAIRACLQVGVKLVIAGPIDDIEYFNREVRPFVDGEKIIYLGNCHSEEIRQLYHKSVATLMPVMWDEPYPLTTLEANATGVPVIGYKRAGLIEQISQGQNGYLVESFSDFVESLSVIDRLSRLAVREYAVANFDWKNTTLRYRELFTKVLN